MYEKFFVIFSIINFFSIIKEVLKISSNKHKSRESTHLYSKSVTDLLIFLLSLSTAWIALAIVQIPS